jgi:hypothetical protein
MVNLAQVQNRPGVRDTGNGRGEITDFERFGRGAGEESKEGGKHEKKAEG